MKKVDISKKKLLRDIDEIESVISSKPKNEINADYHLFKNWVKNFLLSDLKKSDKIDILRYSQDVLVKFRPYCDTKPLKTFIKMIARNRFIDALEIGECISFEFEEKLDYVKDLVKQRPIYILSPKLDMEMGGLGHIVVHRANYLTNQGYDVTILNAGPVKNYKYIKKFYEKKNPAFEKVKFYNYTEYFSLKYSNSSKKPNLKSIFKDCDENFTVIDEYKVKKQMNNDNSLTLTYFDSSENVIKTETYIDECLVFSEDDNYETYYTPDGFKFLELDKVSKHVFLHERSSGLTLEFKHRTVFLNHFLTEVCLLDDIKPFIICDSTTQWYHMNAVSLKKAIKIGCLHGNPFIEFDPKKGIRNRAYHINKIHRYHKVVLLTEALKQDLKGHVDMDMLTVIPNFIEDKYLEYEDCDKDLNKIAIFTRIAPIKQISHIIEAFNMIAHENKSAYLDIYGGTSIPSEEQELVKLTNLIKKYGLEERIKFRGYINDVHSEMRKTFFTLLTSLQEGLSVSTIELMANSAPIISYDVRYGPSDMITNKVDGVLLEEGDIEGLAKTMLDFFNNPEDTLQMGVKAKEKIKNKFSMSKVCPLWEDLFRELFIEDEMKKIIEKLDLKDDYNSSHRNETVLGYNKSVKI